MIRDQYTSFVSRGYCVRVLSILMLFGVAFVIADDGTEDESDPLKRLEQTYREQAAEHAIYRDEEGSQKLELVSSPVYKWTDAQARGRTGGMVFIWTWQGKPEAIAAIFSNPVEPSHRRITHEFHSLSTEVLRPATNEWQPKAGISTQPLSDAPDVAEKRATRMAQMRSIARRFTGHVDKNEQRWEMRFLPQPLYRYAAEDEGRDGAVFAFVTSELTDPEAILLLETVRVGDGYQWGYTLIRFSNEPTYVKYNDEDIWKSTPAAISYNKDRTYQLIQKDLIENHWK